ncbi:helix-turn-helix domain-containing protein [Aliiroseovarius sp. S1339]|uniref:ArsR/SmtB family transcription factor n=1 Tax=Aliiroseovarius sp. S1339 TaxID=2936990 RepID=UPI0020C16F23|nr:metalloregulator ArsR/SmtB family transcription factor [Aliiroseovarius sp. S1339]MCK8464317.1 helix-turn-helix domain-containing protein [Aliiroseovarius sp. S1339]
MMKIMDRSMQIKAMASEVRMQVLRLLSEPNRHFGHQWSADAVEFGVCMTMIAEELGVAQPTASKHLDILKQAGFITVRRHQKWSYCKRDEEAISDYLAWLHCELSQPIEG